MVLVPPSSSQPNQHARADARRSSRSSLRLAWAVPILPLAGLFLAPACGGDETDGQGSGIAIDKYAQEYQQAACEHAVACNFMPDVETCKATIEPSARVVHGVAAVTSGELTYDANAAKSCVDAVRAASCTQGFLFPQSLIETCDTVFGNRKQEGESCFHAIECQGAEAACEGECFDSCCAGTCKTLEGVAQLGEECSDVKPCVSSEGFCGTDPMTMMNVCLPRIAAGKQCPGPDTCVIGYGCDGSSGTCFKQAPAGGSCNPMLQGRVCSHIGEFCDTMTSTCLPYPGAGEPCGQGCASYAFCDANDTCQLRPVAGEPCPGNFCMGDLECSSDQGDGTCGTLPAVVTCSTAQ